MVEQLALDTKSELSIRKSVGEREGHQRGVVRVNQGHTEECPVVEIGEPSKRTVGGGGLERDRDRPANNRNRRSGGSG